MAKHKITAILEIIITLSQCSKIYEFVYMPASMLTIVVALMFHRAEKKPSFTLIAIVTLALGIGANTAIFGVVNFE